MENKGNQGKKKKLANKPDSLKTANMPQPNGPKTTANMEQEQSTPTLNGNGNEMAKAEKPTAGTVNAKEDDSDSSDEFVCHACSA